MEEYENKGVINLIKVNDVAYIWNATDWLRLRSLRIVGCFVGNLVTPSRQGRVTGLPLALLQEETTLLLQKGYATLKVHSNIRSPPSEEIQKKCTAVRKALISEQIELLKQKRKEEIVSKIDLIMKGKSLKKKHFKSAEMTSLKLNKQSILLEEFKKITDPKESFLSVQLCTRDPWIEENDTRNCDWNYPNDEEKYNYLVFKDLWEKGYYVTLGGKFGGNYLVYPGDPIKFHAFFIVVCVKQNERLNMHDIVTYGRLGNSVKKTIVLASLNEAEEVSYYSLQWSGF